MIKQLSGNVAIVSSEELGTRCWHPCRFIQDDGRCYRVFACNYPEKKTCMAIQAEIRHLKLEQLRMAKVIANIDIRIEELALMLKK